jgi:tRNA(Ile)-lysidine synthase
VAGPRGSGGLTPAAVSAGAALLPRCTFPGPGTPVTCAVSGGPDSLALMVLAVAAGCRVTAVHVDHGLRAGSAAEADVVRSVAASLGAGFRAEQVHLEPGANMEARAREARYAVLPPDVLTGHTMDDQAETVILALLRGSGLDGLRGMVPDDRRPLLGLRRKDTVGLCHELGLITVDDPSNADPSHRRNRVRHEVLPLLADVAERDLVPLLARQAALLHDEATLLDELASHLDVTDARALRCAPVPLARRAVRRWLADPYPPDAATVERVLQVAGGAHRACEVGGGRRVERSAGRLRLVAPEYGPRS